MSTKSILAAILAFVGIGNGDDNPNASRQVGSAANSGGIYAIIEGDKLCPKRPDVFCISIAGSNGWSWNWEIKDAKLLQHGSTPVFGSMSNDPGGLTMTPGQNIVGTHNETTIHDIPPEATVIRVMGGQGIKWDTGYDYFRKENGVWSRVN